MAEQNISFKPVIKKATGTPFENLPTKENPVHLQPSGGSGGSSWTPQDYTTVTQIAQIPTGANGYLRLDLHGNYIYYRGWVSEIGSSDVTYLGNYGFDINNNFRHQKVYNNEVLAVVKQTAVEVNVLNSPVPTVANTMTFANASAGLAGVAVSDNYIAIGQPNDSPGSGGLVQIFDRNGNFLRNITAPGSGVDSDLEEFYPGQTVYQYVANRRFGSDLAIYGDTIFIADYAAGVGGQNYAGIVYAYNILDGSKIKVLDAVRGTDFFTGRAMEIDGENLIFTNSRGQIKVFNATDYTLQRTINALGYNRDGFGTSIDISGNYIVVGSHYDTVGSRDYAGRALIYDVRDGSLLHEFADNTTVRFGLYGYCVAIHQNKVAFTSNIDGGTLYVYELS